jgi:predicted nuclease of predicted toxin-antitoxin system
MSYSFDEVIHLLRESTPLYGKVDPDLKFLVDAQLPKRLAEFIVANGFDAWHTLDLPDKNATSDNFIKEKTFTDNLVLISKDDDFLHSHIVQKRPPKLILIKTGNISNADLMEIFTKGLNVLISMISKHSLIEITRQDIVVHS